MPAVAQWTCQRCGGNERRTTGSGCAECHRRASRGRKQKPAHSGLTLDESRLFARLLKDDFEDITVTSPMRAYLEAFTAYVVASRTGDLATRRQATRWRQRLLTVLEGPVSPDVGAE